VRSKGKEIILDAPEKMFQKGIDVIKTLPLHPEWTYRGEFLSKHKHNCLNYSRVPVNNIIIFDINYDEEYYLSYEDKEEEAKRIGLEVVPKLMYGTISSADDIKGMLERESILGGTKIEGIVIKNYSRFNPEKKALMGKFVSEAFKEKHKKEWGESNPGNKEIIQKLIEMLRTDARWRKAIQHLRDAGELENSPRDIGKLMKEIPNDVLKEEEDWIKEMLFRYAWPHISRGITAGFPEHYKNLLLESQFDGDEYGK
jgi:hypothetical protein